MTLDPTLPEDRWVQVNGLNLHYLDWGGDRTKKPLILMHGIGGHAHQFDDFAPLWAETHHVVALDARGCGDSDWAREGYAVQSFAHDVAETARKLGLYPFDYYGYSQGSRIGIALGAYYGDLIDHLVLGDFGPEPDPSPAGRETGRRRMQGTAQRPKGFFSAQQAFDWHREQDPSASDDRVWRAVKYGYRRNWDGILVPKTDPEVAWLTGRTALKESPFLWACVPKISCPTLVLRGETSTVLDRPQAEKVAALIPDGKGRFGEVPGVGHGLHGEDLEATAGVIRAFLEA